MAGYNIILLSDMISELGENKTKKILSEFSCPLNGDVEDFLRNKSIEFAKQRIASTHLIFSEYKEKFVLIGYFALANKVLKVSRSCLSSNLRRRINKFGTFDNDSKSYNIPALLIAQLSKNFSDGYNKLITGDELLAIACKAVEDLQKFSSGKIVYLECEDKPQLKNFYLSNGFCEFGKRTLDKDEDAYGNYLIQMLRYL